MQKDVKLSPNVMFCEHGDCKNMIGYAGALVHHPQTHQRKMVCLPCKDQWYRGWLEELKWK